MRNNLLKNKKAQLTLFVIIALGIVAVLLMIFLPDIGTLFRAPVPNLELKECLQDSVQEGLKQAMLHGGELEPQLNYLYNGELIGYTCYTNKWYDTCVVQKPMLKQDIEKEVEIYVQPRAQACIDDLKSKLESRGYSVNSEGKGTVDIRIIPNNIIVNLDLSMQVEKDDSKQVYEKFSSEIYSEAYDLIMIATSITSWETTYGGAAAEQYMDFYPNLKVERKQQTYGTTIYVLTDRETQEQLIFASRSVARPPGYSA